MPTVAGRAAGVGGRVLRRARAAEVTLLAASIAYYALLSLVPALLLLLAVASAVAGDVVAAALVARAGDLLTPAGESAVAAAFRGGAGRGGATVAGTLVLLWSALRVFRGLDTAFSKVYGVAGRAGLLNGVRDGVVVLAGVAGAVGAMLAAGWLLAAARAAPLVDALGVAALPVVLAAVFLPVYYVFPDTPVTLREAAPGAAVAAVGWTGLQAGFQVYAAGAGSYRAYGVLGGVLLLVTWFYLAAVVLLVGAAVNVVLAGRDRDDRQLQHGAAAHLTTMAEDGDRPADRDRGGDWNRDRDRGPDWDDDRDRDRDDDRDRADRVAPEGAPDLAELADSVDRLRSDLEEFEADVRERTVDRDYLEAELERYVRGRVRRGKARGWGPYLVLLYGTVMTLGAFVYLDGIYAIAAMLVLFLSTLGLYTLFVVVGVGLNALGLSGRAYRAVREFRR